VFALLVAAGFRRHSTYRLALLAGLTTNSVFGLDQDGVGLGKFSPLANKADIAATEKIEQQIADGTITGIPTTLG
jgi:hypothetical protein